MVGAKEILKLNAPAYRIALKAGIHHSTLSKLLCGIEIIKPNDPRVIAVAEVLGVPTEECFEEMAEAPGKAHRTLQPN
jgi:hypothetical protein